MGYLAETDIRYCLTRLPKDLREIIIQHQLVVAGGYIRSMIAHEEVKDIDIFGPSRGKLREAAEQLTQRRKNNGNTDIKLVNSDNAITVYGGAFTSVQFINRWLYDSARDTARSFDFSVCAAAIQWSANRQCWDSFCSDRFYSDLAAKRLYYLEPQRDEDAGGSMLRVTKYLNRGYHISPESLSAVIVRLFKGIDTKAFDGADSLERVGMIRAKLREVDPNTFLAGVGEFDEHENIPVLP